MRRALLRQLPAWSAHYGIHPWEIERLTFDEIAEYQRQFPRER